MKLEFKKWPKFFLYRLSLGEKFKLNAFEVDAQKEAEHLRKLVEIFVIVSFDEKAYIKNSAVRSFVKEVILNKSNKINTTLN